MESPRVFCTVWPSAPYSNNRRAHLVQELHLWKLNGFSRAQQRARQHLVHEQDDHRVDDLQLQNLHSICNVSITHLSCTTTGKTTTLSKNCASITTANGAATKSTPDSTGVDKPSMMRSGYSSRTLFLSEEASSSSSSFSFSWPR